jgi:hypothetical protein
VGNADLVDRSKTVVRQCPGSGGNQ